MKHVLRNAVFVSLISLSIVGCKDNSGSSDNKEFTNPPVEEVTPVEPVEGEPEIPEAEEPIADIEEPVKEEPVTNFATLSWTAPFTRENGEKLHLYEIDYFVITHYWEDRVEEIKVADYSADTYTFNNLPEGVHRFEIQTVDIDGLTSSPSDSVSKTIN